MEHPQFCEEVQLFRVFGQAREDIHFIHVGKCAGTAIKDLSAQINQLQHGPKIKCHGHSTKLGDLPSGAKYFFSIRNPLTRFVSAFYMRKNKEQPRIYREWSAGERLAYEHFAHANDLAENLFEPGDEGRHAFCAIQNIGHMKFQHLWFKLSDILENRPPLCILRQEKLATDVDDFLARIGVQDAAIGLPKDNTRAHKNVNEERPALSDKAIQNLSRWYAVDLEYYRLLDAWIEKRKSQ